MVEEVCGKGDSMIEEDTFFTEAYCVDTLIFLLNDFFSKLLVVRWFIEEAMEVDGLVL